jgi:hypothetical protein
VSGLIRGQGWPLWAISVVGIALIFVGMRGLRAMLGFSPTNGVRAEQRDEPKSRTGVV